MNIWPGMAAAAAVALGGAASAATVDIRHAAARVTVIPEARSDVQVTFARTNARLPMHISRLGDVTHVDGNLVLRGADCRGGALSRGVQVFGVGFVPYDELPEVIVRMPMNVQVRASKAVYGVIGRAETAELDNAGCGDWTMANVTGPATVRVAGSGDVHAGAVGSADVHISGSSDVIFTDIRGGLNSATAGSGDVRAISISGPMHVRVSGSGDVIAKSGQVSDLKVAVAGSGDVKFGGVARSLEVSIAGSGDVDVGKVTGPVSKHIAGSGSVNVGS